jgi:hypothetical protein
MCNTNIEQLFAEPSGSSPLSTNGAPKWHQDCCGCSTHRQSPLQYLPRSFRWTPPPTGPRNELLRCANLYASKRTMNDGYRFPKIRSTFTMNPLFYPRSSTVFLVHFPPVKENVRTMSQNTCPSQWNCIPTQIQCIWCDVVLRWNCAMCQCLWFRTSGTKFKWKIMALSVRTEILKTLVKVIYGVLYQ